MNEIIIPTFLQQLQDYNFKITNIKLANEECIITIEKNAKYFKISLSNKLYFIYDNDIVLELTNLSNIEIVEYILAFNVILNTEDKVNEKILIDLNRLN